MTASSTLPALPIPECALCKHYVLADGFRNECRFNPPVIVQVVGGFDSVFPEAKGKCSKFASDRLDA